MVGGSTRIPKLKWLISKTLEQRCTVKAIDPDKAVAVGAALIGQSSCTVMEIAGISTTIKYDKKSICVAPKTKLPYKKIGLPKMSEISVSNFISFIKQETNNYCSPT